MVKYTGLFKIGQKVLCKSYNGRVVSQKDFNTSEHETIECEILGFHIAAGYMVKGPHELHTDTYLDSYCIKYYQIDNKHLGLYGCLIYEQAMNAIIKLPITDLCYQCIVDKIVLTGEYI